MLPDGRPIAPPTPPALARRSSYTLRLVRDWRSFLVLAGLILVAAIVGVQLLVPAPPKRIRIAAGAEEGMYMDAAQVATGISYRTGWRAPPSSRRRDRSRTWSFWPDGGAGSPIWLSSQAGPWGQPPGVEALGSVFLEPLWVFVRAEVRAGRLAELRGRRIAVGMPGSGTRTLSKQLLEASGVEVGPGMLELGGPDAVKALLDGAVDMGWFVTAKPLPLLDPLLRAPGVRLLSFNGPMPSRAAIPSCPRSSSPPARSIWLTASHPVTFTLLAPAASLVAPSDSAVGDRRSPPGGRQPRSTDRRSCSPRPASFPLPHHVDLPLNTDARLEYGPGPRFSAATCPSGQRRSPSAF